MHARALLETGTAEWLSILVFIFGGCCSNVWALEAVLKQYPSSGTGTFLTFAQIVYVAVQNISSHVYRPPGAWVPRVRARAVPLWKWGVQVVLFLGVSLLNNYAFAFKIPLTLLIIFRSGGLCVSMLTGWLVAGKRYSVGQVLAGVTITVGIVLATLSAPARRPSINPNTSATASAPVPDTSTFLIGVGLLSVALFLSALLGLWQERIYARHGTVWREGLFYSHILSIPFFAPLHTSLRSTFTTYANTAPVTLLTLPTVPPLFMNKHAGAGIWQPNTPRIAIAIPSALAALALNVVTQGFCIKGVNKLTARVSSTTVNLVLTVRKAVSLGLSVWYYGSGVTPGLAIGGGMVLAGTVLYSLAPARAPARSDTGPESEAKKHDPEPTPAAQVAHGKSGSGSAAAVPNTGDGVRRRAPVTHT